MQKLAEVTPSKKSLDILKRRETPYQFRAPIIYEFRACRNDSQTYMMQILRLLVGDFLEQTHYQLELGLRDDKGLGSLGFFAFCLGAACRSPGG